jgi:hypothetical protein
MVAIVEKIRTEGWLRSSFARLAMLLMFSFALGTVAEAQTTASIKGTVTDATGAAVPRAKVVVKSAALGIERTTQTDDTGAYEAPALPPGKYSVEVELQGFEHQIANDVTLEVSQNSVQNFSLKIAGTGTVVTVESTQPVIESTTMSVGQVIDQNVVQEIPLNGRHFVDLALLVPGTVTPPANGFLTAPLRGQGSFAFVTAGNREDAINFLINGINLSDMAQNQITFQPTINTVAEFKIDNSTYSAESGRNSGSIVNIATRSGTEEFHGEVYDYLRNNYFDARNFFNPSPKVQSPLKRNQFGGDFGGPIRHGKTYFFLSYEGLRHRQGLTTTSDVLTDAERTQIQAGTNAVAQGLLNLIPAANGAVNGVPAFFGSATAPVNIDQGTADVSHNFSDSDRIHGYYAYQNDLRQEPTQGANIPGFGDTRAGHRQAFTLGETHVFNPNLINEVRLGVNRIHISFSPNNLTDPGTLGFDGTLGPNLAFIPTILIADLGLQFGAERLFPQLRGDTTVVLGDTVSYIRGRHSFKFGTEFRDFHNDNFNGDPGQLIFNTTAHFIAGTVDTSARTLGNVNSRITENALDFFAQDSFRLKSYLTLEIGLRYAWNKTPTEAMNRFATFDPGTASLIHVNTPYDQNNKNFQPRLGFAWDVFHDGRTVLRAGYGFQVDEPIAGFVSTLSSNPPFAIPFAVNTAATFAQSAAIYNNPTPANLSPVLIDPNFKNAYVQSWNLNIQHQLTHNTAIMVGYFGSKGTHLEIDRNVNQPFAQVNAAANLANRPFLILSPTSPILGGGNPVTLSSSIVERESNSNSNYNALWVTANQHVTRGLQFNASYTYSHSIDDASRNLEGIVVQDSNNVAGSRGSSDFDARHRFVANAIYNLPFKRNRLVSGWEIAPIITAQSGNPFNVVVATANINGVRNSVRPNVSGPVIISGNPGGQWIANPSVFSIPATGFGNLGRNALYGPGFTNVDLAFVKNTKLTERFNLQFRLDAFDLFNHPNFGQPGPIGNGAGAVVFSSAASPNFSTITSTRFPVADSGSSRQLQLALKLQF